MTKLPPARNEKVVVQNVDSEILIYDLETNKVFCLNETSAIVYHACDGKTDFEYLKNKYNFTDDLIVFALDQLKKENLIEDSYISTHLGIKRRELIKKIGMSTMVALPFIISLVAPKPAMAALSCGGVSAPGTFLGCTVLESQCLNMFSMCASCSTSATVMIGPGACDVNNPFLCACD